MNFNYQKAYFVFAVPHFNNLSDKAKSVHTSLIPLVGELQQGRDLSIPLNADIKNLLSTLPTSELAQLSRASYFVGHWQPSNVESLFPNTRGESWKISNCCDQVLRERLALPHNIQIHEGVFRVTFSSRNCWLWEEFGLATEDNLKIFKSCELPFGESTLYKSANQLKKQIGDLWDYDSPEDNKDYQAYLQAWNEQEDKKLRLKIANLVPEAEKAAARKIEEAKIETEALTFLVDNGWKDLDNVIYYSHTKRFCIGWRKALTEQEKGFLLEFMTKFPFDYGLK